MTREALLEEITAQVSAWAEANATTLAEKSALLRALSDTLAETLMAAAPETDAVAAPNAVIEVLNAGSGALYRRYLELCYEENDNGIRLIGEDMAGNEAQLVYLSETALKKMHDLRGAGPDIPGCGHHGSSPHYSNCKK